MFSLPHPTPPCFPLSLDGRTKAGLAACGLQLLSCGEMSARRTADKRESAGNHRGRTGGGEERAGGGSRRKVESHRDDSEARTENNDTENGNTVKCSPFDVGGFGVYIF